MTHSTHCRRFIMALTALCAAACTGTPTPEPPDFLPTPKGPLINAGVMTTEGGSASVEVPISGDPGAVQANTDVWVVNLDDDRVAAKRARADSQGRFLITVAAKAGERLRVVSRTNDQHSQPFDLEAVAVGDQLGVRPLMDTALDCLEVTPVDEVSLTDEGSFVLRNGCNAAVRVSSVQLRFGDQDFALGTFGRSIAEGDELRIRIISSVESADEQADILLLDVQSGTNTGRYALGIWGHE